MLAKTIRVTGKALLACAGIAFGVWQGLLGGDRAAGISGDFVSREELQLALAAAEASVDRKLESQEVAVSALREMLANTDVLLNAVLERLEAAQTEEDLAARQ